MTHAASAIVPAGLPRPLMPYSPAIKAGDWLFVAGQLATDFTTGLSATLAARQEPAFDRLRDEADFIVNTLVDTISPAGASFAGNAVRMWHWYTTGDYRSEVGYDRADALRTASVRGGRDARLGAATFAESHIGISELLIHKTTLEIDLVARLDEATNEVIHDPGASAAGGVKRGGYVFLSSQHGVSTADSGFVEQVHTALERLQRHADTAGTDLGRTYKAEVYLRDASRLPDLDRAWRMWFPEKTVARVIIPHGASAHSDAQVEIALWLVTPDSRIAPTVIETSAAVEPVGHEAQAVVVENLVHFSTQLAVDSTGALAEGMARDPHFPYYGEPARNQMRFILDNVEALLDSVGGDITNVVRRACFHNDFEYFAQSIDEWAKRFPDLKPVSTTLGFNTSQITVPGTKIALDLTAHLPR